MELTYKKTTTQLLHEIFEHNTIVDFFSENCQEFTELSLSAFLNSMLAKHNIKKAEVFRRAGLVGNNYGYELFRCDRKTPSRDILLRLCLAFPMTIDETQLALKNAELATLYPRNKRDAYILFALKNTLSLDELDELLYEKGLDPLSRNT